MQCPRCIKLNIRPEPSDSRPQIVLSGRFLRKHDQTLIQRFRCRLCKKSFSDSTSHPCRYQKKPQLNQPIFEHLASLNSQRRTGMLLRINRKTVVRKFRFMGQWALWHLHINSHRKEKTVQNIVLDDMETFEHTKFKPLSITLAVEDKTRFILGFRVARMPAKGLLAKQARKKYGFRADERKLKRLELLMQLSALAGESLQIKTDQNPHYVPDVRKFFPEARHFAYKGRRGCVVGQGELKSGGWDPLFSLNHTAGMFRANVNRLARRTWCTTKKSECLEWHLAIYAWYHNFVLLRANTV